MYKPDKHQRLVVTTTVKCYSSEMTTSSEQTCLHVDMTPAEALGLDTPVPEEYSKSAPVLLLELARSTYVEWVFCMLRHAIDVTSHDIQSPKMYGVQCQTYP